MTRTTPGLAPPSPNFRATPTGGRLATAPCMGRATGPIHGGSSVESGFEPATLRSRGRDLTTRPPRPLFRKELCTKVSTKSLQQHRASCQTSRFFAPPYLKY
ncbi:hypothetical protein AVEN_124322-1 [Araneus ventricosus]|uniref:Uncharacterized protein n=1 Tax=Araneus ventricosus TaxID=182803 RepID=A0A4Y2MV48_ARAVE|nr:hypothetical protein AVEN_124322-1 [Araneus ventricosus]